MKRSPVRRPAGFSSSGPSRRLSPISRTLRAQDTDGFFVVEAATGASGTSSVGASLRGEAAAAGASPSPETGANGGGIESSGTSMVAASSAAVAGGTPSLAGLGASELLAECDGEAVFDGLVFFFGGGASPPFPSSSSLPEWLDGARWSLGAHRRRHDVRGFCLPRSRAVV